MWRTKEDGNRGRITARLANIVPAGGLGSGGMPGMAGFRCKLGFSVRAFAAFPEGLRAASSVFSASALISASSRFWSAP